MHKVKSEKERKLDKQLANVLKYGVLSALFFASLGLINMFLSHGNAYYFSSTYKEFNPEPFEWERFWISLKNLNYTSLMLIGILLLLLTPIMRVIFAIRGFRFAGDKLYVRIGWTVLIIIILSIFLAYQFF